jgi:branched-chain amino acid transport system permease protein
VGLTLLGLLVLPLVLSPYRLLLMLPFMAYGVILLGLNLLFGYTGLVSFGHALFVGIGAYTGAFLTSWPRCWARAPPRSWASSACAT